MSRSFTPRQRSLVGMLDLDLVRSGRDQLLVYLSCSCQ